MKAGLRTTLLNNRKNIPTLANAIKSRQICKKVLELPAFKNSTHIASYQAMRFEVQTNRLNTIIQQSGKQLYFPYPSGSGHMYMLHANTRKAAERLDLMLIPGVGFDRQGNRLGRGAGYYDRFLSSMPNRPFLVGLAFQEQLLDEVPTERHDVPMDIVLYDEFDASQVI